MDVLSFLCCRKPKLQFCSFERVFRVQAKGKMHVKSEREVVNKTRLIRNQIFVQKKSGIGVIEVIYFK